MGYDASSWAWEARVGSAKLVLVALAEHAGNHFGEDWACFPSVGRLVGMTELGRRTVERHLRFLDAEGFISRKRRVRPDGKLGIFDYTLHRDPQVRAYLKMQRLDEPAANMADGDPAAISDPASGQNRPDPAAKMAGQEPSIEPEDEPSSACAREPGDEGFEEAIEAWPETGRKRTRWPAARAAWALRCSEIGADRMMQAVLRCASDPDVAKGTFGWPGFDGWLQDERFRSWLPGSGAPVLATSGASRPAAQAPPWPTPGTAQQPEPRTAFAGPAGLRAEIVARKGEAWAASYLDGSLWIAGDDPDAVPSCRPRGGTAYDMLRRECGQLFRRFGVTILEPGSHS